MAAAAFAAFGLLFGKVLLHQFVLRPNVVQEILADEDTPATAGMWQLRQENAFPQDIQQELDSVPAADTLSDALWERMQAAGRQHLDTQPSPRRDSLLGAYAGATLARIPLSAQLSWHFSAFDLLWFFLALTTAWRMLAGHPPEAAKA